MKIIRYKGLLGFLVMVALLSAFWLLVIDGCAERTIERVGTRLVGAKVDLASADVTLFPAGMTLYGLEVTDIDKPMTNALEVERIAFTVDGVQLLWRRFIVDEMRATGIRTGTPRKSSGALPKKESKKPKTPGVVEKVKEKIKLPSLEVPDAKEVLEKADLRTIELAKGLEEEIAAKRGQWQERIRSLPDKEKLKEYEERLKKLKKAGSRGLGGALSAVKEIESLRKEIEETTDSLTSAQKEFEEDYAELQGRLEELGRAPAEDVKRLAEKYSLTPEGLSNITRYLFGPRVAGYLSTARLWYKRMAPLLAARAEKTEEPEKITPPRHEGIDVRFPEHNPMPGFLVRNLGASASLKEGDFSGDVVNITSDQNILGKPTKFDFEGKALKNIKSIELSGTLDHVDPEKPSDEANLTVTGVGLSDTILSKDENLRVSLDKGNMDLTGGLRLGGGGKLNGTIAGKLSKLSISAGTEARGGGALLVETLSDALSEVREIELKGTIRGTVDDYDIELSSNLDRVLKDALGKQVAKQTARFKEQLEAGIDEKAKGPIEEAKGKLNAFGDMGDTIEGLRKDSGNLLDSAVPGLPGGGGGKGILGF